MEWTTANNVADIRYFMGLINYYCQFIKGFSNIAFPMTSLYKKGCTFRRIVESQQIFEQLKQLLTTAPMLKVTDTEESFVVSIDETKEGVSRVLTEEGKVIAYESHKLKEYGQQYSTYALELTAWCMRLKCGDTTQQERNFYY